MGSRDRNFMFLPGQKYNFEKCMQTLLTHMKILSATCIFNLKLKEINKAKLPNEATV